VSRFLLASSLAGFVIAIWGFFASAAIRPTTFDLLSNDINAAADAHGFTPEQKELLRLRIAETQAVHSGEVRRYADAYSISFIGLLAVSGSLFVAYVFSKSKRA
jgi:hypothetical protein